LDDMRVSDIAFALCMAPLLYLILILWFAL
jgi:hypothetical protein